MVIDLLSIFLFFVDVTSSVLTDHARFSEFCALSLFHGNLQIRQSASRLFARVDMSECEKVFLELLNQSLKNDCDEYFALMSRIATNADPAELWPLIVGFLRDNLIPYPTIDSYQVSDIDFKDLVGISASNEFVHGMINILQKLALRSPDDFPNAGELMDFILDRVILNGQRYIPAPVSLFPLLAVLLKNESIVPKVIDRLMAFHERLTPGPVPDSLSPQKSLKGFCNMGATCYLNASLHQILRIAQIQQSILAYESESDEDWLFQLQLILAKMFYAPVQSLDMSPYVSLWMGWDEVPVNPREQQDAVEFIQMLLDRLDAKLPDKPVAKSTTGSLRHRLVGDDYESELLASFVDLDLTVKDVPDIKHSLKLFLEPDILKTSVEGRGEIKVQQFQTVKQAPETLILHLKRFEYDLVSGVTRKVNSAFSFPLELDISPILAHDAEPVPTYELTGIVLHGGSALGGHYVSLVKDEQSGCWREFNDSVVRRVTNPSFPDFSFGGTETRMIFDPARNAVVPTTVERCENAYLLVYKQIDRERKVMEPIALMPARAAAQLLADVEQMIFRALVFSREYIHFVKTLCEGRPEADDLLQSLFFKALQFDHASLSEITSFVKSRARTRPDFLAVLCTKGEKLANFLLENSHSNSRTACVGVVGFLVEHGSASQVETLIGPFLSNIKESLAHWHHFDDFFRPILAYCTFQNVELDPLLDSVIALLEEASASSEIVVRGNFAGVFELLLLLSKRVTDIQALRRRIASAKFLRVFQASESAAYDRAVLVLRLQDGDAKLATVELERATSTGSSLSRTVTAGHFAAAVSFQDCQTDRRVRFWFSHFRATQQTSFVAEILREAASFLRAHKAVGCRELFAGERLFERWIIARDAELRLCGIDFIYALFPSFPRVLTGTQRSPIPDGSNTERVNIAQLFRQVLDLRQFITGVDADTIGPVYFDLLGWAARYSGARLAQHRQPLLETLGRIADNTNAVLAAVRCLALIGGDAGSLDAPALRSLLGVVSRAASPDFVVAAAPSVFSLIAPLAGEHAVTIASSKFFQIALRSCARDTVQKVLPVVLNAETAGGIVQALWARDVAEKQFAADPGRCCSFALDILRRFPATVDIFEAKGCHTAVVEALHRLFEARNSLTDYQGACLLAELLGVFSEGFARENRGKKTWLIFSKMSGFLQFWTTNEPFLIDLLAWVQMSAPVPALFSILCLKVIEGALSSDVTLGPVFRRVAETIPREFLVRIDPEARSQCFRALLNTARALQVEDGAQQFWTDNFKLLLNMNLMTQELARLCLTGLSVLRTPEPKKNGPRLAVPILRSITAAIQQAVNLDSFSMDLVEAVELLSPQFGVRKEAGEWAKECGRVLVEAISQLKFARQKDIPNAAQRIEVALEFRKRCTKVAQTAEPLDISPQDIAELKKQFAGTPLEKVLSAGFDTATT
jgi:ubiquitin C-terminal hydrolase